MAEKLAVNTLKEYSHDINDLSDNEFHSLLEEAISMTSNKLQDKSPILQKLLHEVKVDDDLKASNKHKSGGPSNNRIVLGKKRPDRKRGDEQKSTAASCMAQGGSLQNLSRKFEGDCRLKNKLQKSDSLSSFSVVQDKVRERSAEGGGVKHYLISNHGRIQTAEVDGAKIKNGKTAKNPGNSSHDRNDSYDVDRKVKCNCAFDERTRSTAGSVSQPVDSLCKSDCASSDDFPRSLSWREKTSRKEEEDVEMMEIDRSDDEYVTAFNSPGKIIRDGKVNFQNFKSICNTTTSEQSKRSEEETLSAKQIMSSVTDEVDTAIRLPLTTLLEKDTQCSEKFKDSVGLPGVNFSDRSAFQESFSLRDRKLLTDESKRSNLRSSLDINGNPLGNVRKAYNTTSGFSHYGKKESNECILDRNLMSGDKQRKTKRTKGAHTLKEMKAGDVSGNIGNLSIEKLVEYINSADKKTKSTARNMLIETNNKKTNFKNNKVPLQKMKKNEKENNKKNLPEIQFIRRNPNEMIKEDANTSESETSLQDVCEKEYKNDLENPAMKMDDGGSQRSLCKEPPEARLREPQAVLMSPNDSNDIDFEGSSDRESTRNSVDNTDALSASQSDNGAKPPPAEDAEFHIVMKKHRRNRSKIACSVHRNKHSPVQMSTYSDECDFSRFPWSYARKEEMFLLTGLPLPQCNQRSCMESRRKSTSSMPPSDHSSVDNSDLDSVHSLPVKSTTVKPIIAKTSSSSSSTPRASYADIAKMYTTASLQRSHFVSSLHPTFNVAITSVTENMLSPLLLESMKRRTDQSDRSISIVNSCFDRNKKTLTHSASYPTLAEAAGVAEDNLIADSKMNITLPSCKPFDNVAVCSPEAATATSNGDKIPPTKDNCSNASHITNLEESDANDRQPSSSSTVHCKELAETANEPSGSNVVVVGRMQDKNASSTKNAKKTQPKLLPPVIIMDNYEPLPNELELTFGFEINEQLLSMTNLGDKNGASNGAKSCDISPDQSKRLGEDIGSFNYSHVVHYITETWDGILKEFEQEHVSSEHHQNRIKYYSGE